MTRPGGIGLFQHASLTSRTINREHDVQTGISLRAALLLAGSVFCLDPLRAQGTPADTAALRLEFAYITTIRNIPSDSRTLRVWIPAPQDDEYQLISRLEISGPVPCRELTDSIYGNTAFYFEMDSLVPDSLTLSLRFHAQRRLAAADTLRPSPELMRRFLSADQLVPIDGAIAQEALAVVSGKHNDQSKARAIYDHILRTMSYDKSGTGWGQGDARFACTERRGNCSDIHSLLIGMARASGIPARFVMGFPIPTDAASGSIAGYHCWADLYIKGEGWIPVDASEAIKHPERAGELFGTLDPHRVAFTIGRDIPLGEKELTPTVNYFIYPYVLVDGREYSDVARRIEYRVLEDPAPAKPGAVRSE
jgi:transglutaminase-like putative cysteine protease